MKNTITLEDISTLRNDTIINSKITFTVCSGNAIVVRGENGVGKTTLMRAIAGFLPIENGTISINDSAVNHTDLSQVCHFVGEQNALKENYSVIEDLQHWAMVSGIKKSNSIGKIKQALKSFRISPLANIKTNLLSQGQKKRVALARLLVLNRPIWLLDEPTSGLDKNAVDDLTNTVQIHLKNGGIVICTSHIDIDFIHTDYELLRGGNV